MIKNISETIRVPASFLVDGFNELSNEVKEKVILMSKEQMLAKSENRGIDESDIDEVFNLLPEKMRQDLSNIGAKLPSDLVALTMRLGDFIYHVYAINNKPSQAPLAIKRYEKKLMELADALDRDEFDISSDVLAVIESVIGDEKKWESTQFGASLVVDNSNKYIGLSAIGASFFKKIVDAAASLFV